MKRFLSWVVLLLISFVTNILTSLVLGVGFYVLDLVNELTTFWRIAAYLIGGSAFLSFLLFPAHYGALGAVTASEAIKHSNKGMRYVIFSSCMLAANILYMIREFLNDSFPLAVIFMCIYYIMLIITGKASVRLRNEEAHVQNQTEKPVNKQYTFSSPEENFRNVDLRKSENVSQKSYCRICGSLIETKTKKCPGCGKQYFRGINTKLLLNFVFGTIILVSLSFNIILYIGYVELADEKHIVMNEKQGSEKATLEGLKALIEKEKDPTVAAIGKIRDRQRKEKVKNIIAARSPEFTASSGSSTPADATVKEDVSSEYDKGYDKGYNKGYDAGYNVGYNVGYSKGKSKSTVITQPSITYSYDSDDETCIMPGCDSSPSRNSFYCYSHECMHVGCHNKIANDYCNYCINHKCLVPDCNFSQAYNSIYCYIHKD